MTKAILEKIVKKIEITASLLAILTVTGYILSYSFETGVYEYFDLPIWLVTIDMRFVIASIIDLGTSIVIVFVSLCLLTRISKTILENRYKKLLDYIVTNKKTFLLLPTIVLIGLDISIIGIYSNASFIIHNTPLRVFIILACVFCLILLILSLIDTLCCNNKERQNSDNSFEWISTYHYKSAFVIAYFLIAIPGTILLGRYIAASGVPYLTYYKSGNYYIIPGFINEHFAAVQINKKKTCLMKNFIFLPSDKEYHFGVDTFTGVDCKK